MKIHSEPLPLRGQTVFQAQIASELSLVTPLATRLAAEALRAGLVSETDRDKFVACFEEALKNAILHGSQKVAERFVFVRVYYNDSEWGVAIEDQGDGFSQKSLPDREATEYPWTDKGRGIALMNHVMERVDYFNDGRSLLLSQSLGRLQLRTGETSPDACSLFVRVLGENDGMIARLMIQGARVGEVRRVFQSLREFVESSASSPVVIDFTSVEYLNSDGIGQLVQLARTCSRLHLELRLAALSPALENLFDHMRLLEVFQVFDTVAEAKAVVAAES